MILPETLLVGVPCARDETPPPVPLVEVGKDQCDLPSPEDVRRLAGERALTLVAWHVLTHRRTDPRYRQMRTPIPEHAAVGHFERSRWTDEAWERTDALARALGAQAVLLRTPPSFKSSTEHATRLENFVAHASRPGLALAWEWEPASWQPAKALALCSRIGAIPVVDPTVTDAPEEDELVYLRFRCGTSGRKVLKDDDLKRVALAVRDRVGWVVFSNVSRAQDAGRFLRMI